MRCSKIGIVLVRSDAPRCTSIRVGNDYKSILCNKSYCTPLHCLWCCITGDRLGLLYYLTMWFYAALMPAVSYCTRVIFYPTFFPCLAFPFCPKIPTSTSLKYVKPIHINWAFFTRTCINFPWNFIEKSGVEEHELTRIFFRKRNVLPGWRVVFLKAESY